MSNRLKRASLARLAVGLAVLAFPLLATSVAQAALAGAIPSTTTIHPDVRSATIDPTAGDFALHVCFDKQLNGSFVPGDFAIAGYRAGNLHDALGVSTDPSNTNCVFVVWPSSIGDINQYTAVEIAPGAVEANAGSVPNLVDSVGITGSISHAGVTGITVAPNLAGVLPPSGANQVSHSLTFVFDKTTDSPAANNAGYFFETAAGQTCMGVPAFAPIAGNDSTTITIAFNDAPCGGVVNAIRAGLFAGTVTAPSDAAATNPNMSTIMPNCNTGTNCPTSVPDLVSAQLNADNDSITYTFDKNVVVFPPNLPSDFLAELANGTTLPSTSAVCGGGTTCVAQFSGTLSKQAEFGVLAWVSGVAVHPADNPTVSNLAGSAKIGDNAGAFSRAFTTGPDVFGVQMNKSTGLVSVNLDDRVVAVDTADINLIAGDGGIVAATPSPSFNSSAGPGPTTVQLQYPASVLTNVTQVQFLGCPGAAFCGGGTAAFTEPFSSVISPFDAKNLVQIVGAVNSGAILRGYHLHKHAYDAKIHSLHNKKHHKKHSKRTKRH